jgi:hypothetical protein
MILILKNPVEVKEAIILKIVKEVSLGLEFNFFDFNLHELKRQITPYVYSGSVILDMMSCT